MRRSANFPDVCQGYRPLSPLEDEVLAPREAGQVEETSLLIKRILGRLDRAGEADRQALGVGHPTIRRETNESVGENKTYKSEFKSNLDPSHGLTRRSILCSDSMTEYVLL